jgi:protein-disulfide isomerase
MGKFAPLISHLPGEGMSKAKNSESKTSMTKRQMIKERRRQQQRRQRLSLIAIVAAVALGIAALLIVPGILEASKPVGEFVRITPTTWPMVKGSALGDPNAPVKIEVWEDFQCPACQTYTREIEPLVIQEYIPTGQVYYIFRQFPFLDDNAATKESDQAANASMCAAEQERFWDYHNILFANWNGENLGAFSNRRLVAFAESLELDMPKFNACFKENRYKAEIAKDLSDGRQAGVQGTPSIFLNGELLTPGRVPQMGDIKRAVEAALAGSGN